MKIINIIISITILSILNSCGYDLSDDDSTKDLLVNHTIFLGGNVNFKKDGTFEMKPQSPSDPTQKYIGTWEIGYCNNCETDYTSRDITIEFKNRGHVTDGATASELGYNETGLGTHLEGYIEKIAGEYQIEFKKIATGNLYIESDGSQNYDRSESYIRELQPK